MNGFSGIRDIDMLILLNLKDAELSPVSLTNSYLSSICSDEVFWSKRIINRIKKSLEDTLKLIKFIRISINFERIQDMKKHFGFSTLQELNTFLNDIPSNGLYYLYATFKSLTGKIETVFKCDEKLLPEYIDTRKLKFYLIKEFTKGIFQFRRDNSIILPPLYIKNDTPGFKNNPKNNLENYNFVLGERTYQELKFLKLRG